MSLEGRLEDLSLPDIFQIVSLSKRSGALVMVRKEGVGRVVFNRGHVFYASSDNKNRLGYTLVRKAVIRLEDLDKALKTQKVEGFKKPLGTIMVEMGIVSPEVLEKEVARHIIEVIHELLRWEEGVFHFEPSAPGEPDVVLESGLSTEFLLLEATRLKDEDGHQGLSGEKTGGARSHPAPAVLAAPKIRSSASEMEPGKAGFQGTLNPYFKKNVLGHPKEVQNDHRFLTLMNDELSKQSSRNEITLLVLRFASELMNRAVIFLSQGGDVSGLGQSGVVLSGGVDANKRIREIRIPLAEESIFKSVAEKGRPYRGKLAEGRWNRLLAERLGRGWPPEVFAAPLMNEDRVVAILYCDNLPAQESIGETGELETFLRKAGPALGRALAEDRRRRIE